MNPCEETTAGLTRTVLIVDDDPVACDIYRTALTHEGVGVRIAHSGNDALQLSREDRIDFVVLDLKLPDCHGISVARAIRRRFKKTGILVITGFASVRSAVEAMKLGAVDVLEKPVDIDAVTDLVRGYIGELTVNDVVPPAEARAPQPGSRPASEPGSAAERWASYALAGVRSIDDPSTLQDWAHDAGVSYSSLCEICRILGLQPSDAKDFVRLVRALHLGANHNCDPWIFLNIGDRRTLQALLGRAGATIDGTGSASLTDFIATQQLVPATHECVRIFARRLLRPDAI